MGQLAAALQQINARLDSQPQQPTQQARTAIRATLPAEIEEPGTVQQAAREPEPQRIKTPGANHRANAFGDRAGALRLPNGRFRRRYGFHSSELRYVFTNATARPSCDIVPNYVGSRNRFSSEPKRIEHLSNRGHIQPIRRF